MQPTLSYCVVNTNGRELLLECLAAIDRHHPRSVPAEVLVLDNASADGSADAVRAWDAGRGGADAGGGAPERGRSAAASSSGATESASAGAGSGGGPSGNEADAAESRGGAAGPPAGPLRLIALEQPEGKAANDSRLLAEARGRYCLLLNEDSELRAGAAEALIDALAESPSAAAAGAQLLDSSGEPVPCAWRFPGVGAALIGALVLHRRFTVQSEAATASPGPAARESAGTAGRSSAPAPYPVDWAQSSALLVRREAAAQVGYLDPAFFVYYDECDLCKRLADAGWQTLFVPAAEAVHHDQLSTDLAAGLPRIVEFHRNRDLYMRKHHSAAAALAVRVLTAWAYALRALAATVLPGHSPRIQWAHARQALLPHRGQSIRDRVVGRNGLTPSQ